MGGALVDERHLLAAQKAEETNSDGLLVKGNVC